MHNKLFQKAVQNGDTPAVPGYIPNSRSRRWDKHAVESAVWSMSSDQMFNNAQTAVEVQLCDPCLVYTNTTADIQ